MTARAGHGHSAGPGADSDPDAYVDEALSGFGLGGAAWAALPRGLKARAYRVTTQEGSWLLKWHPARAESLLQRSHEVVRALVEAGFPAPAVRVSPRGESLVTTPAGLFSLQAWVEGMQVSIAEREETFARWPELATTLGRVVGDLHRLAAPAMEWGGAPADPERLLAGPRATVGSIKHGPPHRFRKLARVRLRRPRTEFDDWLLSRLPDLAARARGLAAPRTRDLIDGADEVLGHNDWNWENLILDGHGGVAAVVDYDNVARLPRALEVGAAAVVLVGADPARLEAFLDGYAQGSQVAVSPQAARVGMQWKCVRSSLWSVDSYLSGRARDTDMLLTWCTHLEEALGAVAPLGTSAESA